MASSFSERISNHGEPILAIAQKRICLQIFIQASCQARQHINHIYDLQGILIPIDYKKCIETQ